MSPQNIPRATLSFRKKNYSSLFLFQLFKKEMTKRVVLFSPIRGIASEVLVMTCPTNREKTVCDRRIVTPAKININYETKPNQNVLFTIVNLCTIQSITSSVRSRPVSVLSRYQGLK